MANWRSLLVCAALAPTPAIGQSPGLQAAAEAFNRCVVDEARRLEPSGEQADLVARAAVFACRTQQAALSVKIADSVTTRKELDDLTAQATADAREGALLTVVNARATKRAK